MKHFRGDASFDRHEIEAALANVLRGAAFHRNANSTKFLRFVVEETLEGRGDRLKGFTIAISALGRHSNFDAQNSSAVRVQANRLRRLLEEYYRGSGSQDPVRIVLPLGSYQPRFERRPAAEPVAQPSGPPDTAPPSPARAKASPLRIAGIAAAACLAVASAALFVQLSAPAKIALDGGPSDGRPIVIVESAGGLDARQGAKDVAELAVAAIESELSVFDHFVVERRADAKSAAPPDYALSVRAGPPGEAMNDFTFQLVHLPTNEIVWTRTIPEVNIAYPATIRKMTRTVAPAVGDIYVGAIIADQRRRAVSSSRPVRGRLCLLVAYDYILSRSLAERDKARGCIEQELSINPKDSRALTLLSSILLHDYRDVLPGNKGLEDIEYMGMLAQRAFEISPYRVETASVLFLSRFYSQRFADAFGMTNQLFQDIPNSRLLSAIVGDAYIARGRYDEGMLVLGRLEEEDLGAPGFSIPMLALGAYMRGDEATAERFALRPEAGRFSMGLVMRIVICAKERKQTCAVEASQQLRRNYPGFAADVPTALFRNALADDIRATLLSDLRAAGFFGEAPW